MTSIRTLFPICGMLLAVSSGVNAAPTPRIAWVGLEPGPLSPVDQRSLEALIVDELDGYLSLRLVDAAGTALDPRLLASDASKVARLKNEGIDLFLAFKHQKALQKLKQAKAVFESRLLALPDYELLQDTLLAMAEAQYQAGEIAEAELSLRNLASLAPKRHPEAQTHPENLVKLWEKIVSEQGHVGSIRVECPVPQCQLYLDGQSIGTGPMLATRILPGKHYLVAKWPHAIVTKMVQVAEGSETKVVIKRDGPSEQYRKDLLDAVAQRRGLATSQKYCQQILGLSRAKKLLVGAVRRGPGGKLWLVLSRHNSSCQWMGSGRAEISKGVQHETAAIAVRQLAAAHFVSKQEGEFEIDRGGTIRLVEGVSDLVYGGKLAKDWASQKSTPPKLILPPEEVPPAPAEPIYRKWWFWTAVGVVVVAAGTSVAIAAGSSGDPTETQFEVVFP